MALRLCSKSVQRVVDPIFCRSLVITRVRKDVKTTRYVLNNFISDACTIGNHLMELIIRGDAVLGSLTITTCQLWMILAVSPALSTVLFRSVRISGPPSPNSTPMYRFGLKSVTLTDIRFDSPDTFVETFVVFGQVSRIILERPRYHRPSNVGSPDAAVCSLWRPRCFHLSILGVQWSFMGHFASYLRADDERFSAVHKLDISLGSFGESTTGAGLRMIRASEPLGTLRLYLYPSERSNSEYRCFSWGPLLKTSPVHSDKNLQYLTSDLSMSYIDHIELVLGDRLHPFSPDSLVIALECITAVPNRLKSLSLAFSALWVEYMLSGSVDCDPFDGWPLIVDALRSLPHYCAVKVFEWHRMFPSERHVAASISTSCPSEMGSEFVPCRPAFRDLLRNNLYFEPVIYIQE